MFYDGDLQSGISLAMSEEKFVGCFVHDDSETSKTWEEDFLISDDLPKLLGEKVVLLKLREGSTEAGFLSQMYPIKNVPTFVLLGGGLLKVYITSNPPVTKGDFIKRLKAALQDGESQPTTSTPPQPTQTTPTTTTTATQPSSSTSTSTPNPNQQLFTDRAKKLAADKATRDAAEKANREALAAQAAATKAAYEAGKPIDPKKAAELKYAKLRNERLKTEKDDLAKIRKRVEDDKIERKMREAERRERSSGSGTGDGEKVVGAGSGMSGGSGRGNGGECAIQIRLFDGSTIRQKFPATATLRSEVREWITNQQQENQFSSSNIPYSFKHVLTPLPNRTLSITEEEASLQELGLVPSATLILSPVKEFVDAYDGGGGVGRGLVGGVLGVVGSVVGVVGGILGSVLPGTAAPTPTTAPDAGSGNRSGARNMSPSEGNREARENREFYNGNNLSFEPRRDEEEEEE